MNATACVGLRLLLAAAGFLVLPESHASSAQTLYKCVAGNDEVTIQSNPCPASSRTEWERPVDPNLQRGNVPVRQPAASAPRPVPQQRVTYPSGPSATELRNRRCNHARQTAASERDRNWRTITFERRRQLDNWVREQCR